MRTLVTLIELALGFGPIFVMWALGVAISPALVLGIIEGDIDAALLGLSIVLGGLGLWGVLQLSIVIMAPEVANLSARKLLILMLCGYASGLYIWLSYGDNEIWPTGIVVLLPMLIAPHLLYMARGYLFNRS